MLILIGSSDGLVRVFTKDPNRYADESVIKQFEEEVQKMQAANQQEIGGFKLSEYVFFSSFTLTTIYRY